MALFEVKEALKEILDIAPMFRRDYIFNYIRTNLPEDEAKRLYFEKDKKGYIKRMMDSGYIGPELLEKIGRERVMQYFRVLSNQS
jgi:hypothetical protein